MKRKGYSRIADVPADLLQRLNQGAEEAITLSEVLAIDFQKLLTSVVPEAKDSIDPSLGITQRMQLAAAAAVDALGAAKALTRLIGHHSDTARGWAAYVIGTNPKLTQAELFRRIQPLADDPNSGVREWAWLGIRPRVAADIEQTVSILTPWTGDESANVRRFATESTRPRGVWCAHIDLLKTNPEIGLPLLQALRADEAKYVQDSVGNWLNDAAKSNPDWVGRLVAGWRKTSNKATERIAVKALRSIA